jgi:hypothetical protein
MAGRWSSFCTRRLPCRSPKRVPAADADGKAWYVDVRNLGPGEVALEGVEGFVVHLQPKQVVRIRAAVNTYTATKP